MKRGKITEHEYESCKMALLYIGIICCTKVK